MEDVQSTRFLRPYKLNVITVFSVGHLFHVNVIILQVNFWALGAFTSSWHKFKHSAMLEVGLLHLQQFIHSHFYFLIILRLAASNCDLLFQH